MYVHQLIHVIYKQRRLVTEPSEYIHISKNVFETSNGTCVNHSESVLVDYKVFFMISVTNLQIDEVLF